MTTKALPGEWYTVEGKPFQMPYRDRTGAAIQEGDEVLYASETHLRRGRIVVIGVQGLCHIRKLDGPMTRRHIYRCCEDLVLTR